MEKPPYPSSVSPGEQQSVWHNWITISGLGLTATAFVLLLTFALFQFLIPSGNPYVSIIGVLVLPGFLGIGLAVVPFGMLVRFWRLRRAARSAAISFRLPRIDLNNPRHRRWILTFSGITLFVTIPVLSVASYQGYHYTDSTDFCANVCHTVMEPQAVTYESSPHARVTCAECHIGSGASWFVKSKLSGTRQVIAVWRDSYSRPIPPAITELRPARETCEQCHWPAKFFGWQLKTRVHYSSDESNTRREVRMLVRTGGADPASGRVEGIHMHMALSGRVDFVATDPQLQEVPWVRHTDADGRVKIYRSDGLRATDPPPPGTLRVVDCMDCHNRAAHNFHPPQESVNLLLSGGQLDVSLPFIKEQAVAAMEKPWPDLAAAESGIQREIESYYSEHHPSIWSRRRSEITAALETVQKSYRRTFFPEMKVSWSTYPDNIGHTYSAGCLRCHDGRHVSDDGRAISSDCRTCHVFLNPVEGVPGAVVEGEFQHAMPLVAHPNLRCTQCHTGGTIPQCRTCHESGTWLEQRGKGAFSPKPSLPERTKDPEPPP